MINGIESPLLSSSHNKEYLKYFNNLTFLPDARLPLEIADLREHSVHYLLQVFEKLKLDAQVVNVAIIGQTEGVRSACFRIELQNGKSLVIKLALSDASDAATALKSWASVGAHVPNVYAAGSLSVDTNAKKVFYIVMDLISAKNESERVLDGYEYLDAHHTETDTIGFGIVAGNVLAGLHASPQVSFFGKGDFAFTTSYAEQITNLLAERAQLITDLGFPLERFSTFQHLLGERSSENGSWVHGDFGPHNILVVHNHPLELAVIDPMAFVSDCYWDLATVANKLLWMQEQFADNQADKKLGFKLEREEWFNHGVFLGYATATNTEIDVKRLKLNQIAQFIWKITKSETDGVMQLTQGLIRNHHFRKVALNKLLQEL